MNDKKLLEEIVHELRVLTCLTAAQLLRQIEAEGGKQKDKIEALGGAGLDNQTIASVVGASSDTVRSTLSRARKK